MAFHATASSALATLIYYSDYGAGAVYRTDGHTTKTLVTGLNQPMKIVLASDGSFYVAIQSGQTIRHFSSTGVPIGASFGTGSYHTGLALGPDGKLYVSATDNSFSIGYIQRYNLGTNTPAPSVYTDHSPAQYTQFSSSSYFEGVTFGPDGHLYASANGAAAIFEYQGPSEASPGTFIKSIASGFHTYGLTFGPDGRLYAGDFNNNIIYRYNGTAFAPFATTHLAQPVDPVFGPDGNLYVTNFNGKNITRYQGPAGASPGTFIDVFTTGGQNPSYMAIVPEPATCSMIAVGGAVVVLWRWRRKSATAVQPSRAAQPI